MQGCFDLLWLKFVNNGDKIYYIVMIKYSKSLLTALMSKKLSVTKVDCQKKVIQEEGVPVSLHLLLQINWNAFDLQANLDSLSHVSTLILKSSTQIF